MMIESNVIERGKYENSSLSLAPWQLRSLRENGTEITASDIKDNRLFTLFPNFKRRWKKCKETCRFRECHIEAFSPYTSDVELSHKSNVTPVETAISVSVSPPQTQVIKVESRAKIGTLDFVVYILSVLSFWFGFCPLHAAGGLKKAFKPVVSLMSRLKLISLAPRNTEERRLSTASNVVTRISSILLVTCGFLYQTHDICDQYFRYPTVTSVSANALPLTIPPKVTLEYWHPPRTGWKVSDVFKEYRNDHRVIHSKVKQGVHEEIQDTRYGRFLLYHLDVFFNKK